MTTPCLTRVTRRLARWSFPVLERLLDVHITPNDYHSPILSMKDLPPDIHDRASYFATGQQLTSFWAERVNAA